MLTATVFDSVDKQGGFIGAMYANGTNVAVELVREGFVARLWTRGTTNDP